MLYSNIFYYVILYYIYVILWYILLSSCFATPPPCPTMALTPKHDEEFWNSNRAHIPNISVDSIVFRDCLHRLEWICAGFRVMLCGRCSCIQCDASAHYVLEYSMRKGAKFLVAEEWLERSLELAARHERSSMKLAAQKATPKCSGVPGCDKKNRSGINLN